MALDVPEPSPNYLAAEEAKDSDALSVGFTEDGTVHDEGRESRSELEPPMEASGGRELPIRPATFYVQVRRLGDLRARPR